MMSTIVKYNGRMQTCSYRLRHKSTFVHPSGILPFPLSSGSYAGHLNIPVGATPLNQLSIFEIAGQVLKCTVTELRLVHPLNIFFIPNLITLVSIISGASVNEVQFLNIFEYILIYGLTSGKGFTFFSLVQFMNIFAYLKLLVPYSPLKNTGILSSSEHPSNIYDI